MKNFFTSFLGALAALWVTIGIMVVMGIVLMVMMVAGLGGQGAVSVPRHSVMYVSLGETFVEYPQQRSLMEDFYGMGREKPRVLHDVITALERACGDRNIEAVFIDCNGIDAGWAQCRELRLAIAKLHESEVPVYAYGDAYTQQDYFIASVADSIFINPCGMVDIHGLAAQTVYYKGLLDKLGVNMQVLRVGEYKSAVEPFILTGPSEASQHQQEAFLGSIWRKISGDIAYSRGLKAADVNSWANGLLMARDMDYYLKNRVVDAAVYRHQFIDKLCDITGEDELRMVTPEEYLASGRGAKKRGNVKIGVYYAEGDIVDDGTTGIVGSRVVDDLLKLAQDDDLDALVLRVNSGGGSAFASEQIWEALEQWKEMTGKQFYVSMSDYAASGGYYISCGAHKIYADPQTITGSIGIFGLVPDARGLLTDRLGLTSHTVGTNPAGNPPTVFNPLTPEQRTEMQAYVERGYELFLRRVAQGRNMPVDSVRAIASGRVWDAMSAKRIGLVDDLKSLNQVLEAVALELGSEGYRTVSYPVNIDLWWSSLFPDPAMMSTQALFERLGESAELYVTLDYLSRMQGVQARMPLYKIL